ncbi:MAG: hypothetical protein QXG91_05045 [Candidatus Aenigmatarchaeota archaeon]
MWMATAYSKYRLISEIKNLIMISIILSELKQRYRWKTISQQEDLRDVI